VTTISKTTSSRLARWAVLLGQNAYTIYHIAGELNVWGDLLSRWVQVPVVQHQMMLLQGVSDGESMEVSEDFPTATIIAARQELSFHRYSLLGGDAKWGENQERAPMKGPESETYFVEHGGQRKVWIPNEDVELSYSSVF
jgi:hypothetical protein